MWRETSNKNSPWCALGGRSPLMQPVLWFISMTHNVVLYLIWCNADAKCHSVNFNVTKRERERRCTVGKVGFQSESKISSPQICNNEKQTSILPGNGRLSLLYHTHRPLKKESWVLWMSTCEVFFNYKVTSDQPPCGREPKWNWFILHSAAPLPQIIFPSQYTDDPSQLGFQFYDLWLSRSFL